MARRNKLVVRAECAAVAAVAALAVGVGAPPASADKATSLHGVFEETAQGADIGYDIHGSVKMTIGSSGTVVRVNVSGLDPEKAYGSHLHNGTCASGGGGHYQNVVSTTDVTPPNELWLTSVGNVLVPNPGGVGHGEGSATWMDRISSDSSNARSVVVHEPGGVRIACADLQ